ncbi:MAG TPA: hypothetical protein VKX17_17225 [Planctomycetota bacterium]|nr:hypothetical protein [Planctomycetota bacterium]
MKEGLTVRVGLSTLGWPFDAADTTVLALVPGDGRPFDIIGDRVMNWHADKIIANVLVALGILFAVWFVCERWIAWRAGRKKA